MQQVEALAAAKAGNQPDWWRPLEACLAAVDCDAVTDAIEDEKDANRPAPIDVELLLTKILPSLISDPCEWAPSLFSCSVSVSSNLTPFLTALYSRAVPPRPIFHRR